MNIFIGILLLCALLGLWDKISGGKMGLAAEFDGGLASMASLALSIVGIYCIGVTAVRSNPEAIASFASRLPFDASVLIGSLLAPDLGGHAIAKELAATPALGIYSGVMVSSCLGRHHLLHPAGGPEQPSAGRIPAPFMQGSVWGIVTIPAGSGGGGCAAHRPARGGAGPATFCRSSFCAPASALALLKAAEATIRARSAVGDLVRIASLVLFALVMLGVFLRSCQTVSDDLFFESLTIVVKDRGGGGRVDGGGLPDPRRFFQKGISPDRRTGWGSTPIRWLGLIASLATCISMIPMLDKMDERGKVMNAGFAVSGAFVLGGQLAFNGQCGARRRWRSLPLHGGQVGRAASCAAAAAMAFAPKSGAGSGEPASLE